MARINTFGRVMEMVYEMSTLNRDEVIPVRDMAFEGLDRIRISEEEVEVLPTAQRLLANRLRVPYSYLVRCPRDLQAENLNYWMGEEAKKREALFCRFNGEGLRAVFTDRYTLVLKVPDFTRRFDLQGEGIVPGISVANSEVGLLALSIEAYFFRLVCSNGLISRTEVSSRFKHVSRKALEQFPELLGQVVRESEEAQRRFRVSLQSRLMTPWRALGRWPPSSSSPTRRPRRPEMPGIRSRAIPCSM